MDDIDIDSLWDLVDDPHTIIEPLEPLLTTPTQTDNTLLFTWNTTETALKSINPKVKITSRAKHNFACTISSFADEVMEHMLTHSKSKYITVHDVGMAFESMEVSLHDLENMHKQLSLGRLIKKHRYTTKFTVTMDAKTLLSQALYSLMILIACNIHIYRDRTTKLLTHSDIDRITDTLNVRRMYTQPPPKWSRQIQAMMRKRLANGRYQ